MSRSVLHSRSAQSGPLKIGVLRLEPCSRPTADATRTDPLRDDAIEQGTPAALLDHLVGATEHCRWDGDAKHFRGLQIDHKLEPGRLFDRQVRRLGTL